MSEKESKGNKEQTSQTTPTQPDASKSELPNAQVPKGPIPVITNMVATDSVKPSNDTFIISENVDE